MCREGPMTVLGSGLAASAPGLIVIPAVIANTMVTTPRADRLAVVKCINVRMSESCETARRRGKLTQTAELPGPSGILKIENFEKAYPGLAGSFVNDCGVRTRWEGRNNGGLEVI